MSPNGGIESTPLVRNARDKARREISLEIEKALKEEAFYSEEDGGYVVLWANIKHLVREIGGRET